MQLLRLILKGKVDLLEILFGIEEPLSIFSMHSIENIEFFNIDSSIYGSSILRNIENVDISHYLT
jgi:hypothetical protein